MILAEGTQVGVKSKAVHEQKLIYLTENSRAKHKFSVPAYSILSCLVTAIKVQAFLVSNRQQFQACAAK